MANPHPPPHTSLHPSPPAAAAAGGSLTGTGPSSGERCGDTPGRYPHINTTRSLFPVPCPPPPSSSFSSSPPPPPITPPPPRPFIASRIPRLSESTADFSAIASVSIAGGRGWDRSKQGVGCAAAKWEAAATCFPSVRLCELRVLGRISFSGGRGATSDANVAGSDTWRARGRWIDVGVRGQEAAGSFWKSEARGPGEADVSERGGGHVARTGGQGTVVGGRGRRDVVGHDLTTSSRGVHQLKYCMQENGAEVPMASFRARIRSSHGTRKR